MKMLMRDFQGAHGSVRYVLIADDDSRHVYEGKEASAISALLARKVDPQVVLDALFGRDNG